MKIQWNDIVRKLTSRKLWVAVASMAAGLALCFGGDATDLDRISGAAIIIANSLGYIVAEANVDAAGKTDVAELLENIVVVEDEANS